ncbi:MAG: thermonuclease family protein [Candidatus Pelagibacter sp. TMED263]|nr:MAG: thermonuclease family protein [Candidatus Pelagibacter sp. TMED263]
MFLIKIKPFLVISICVLVLSLTNINVQSQEVKLISGIAKVVDGDTIKIENKKIRLFGIDAPEKKQKCRKPWLTISFLTFNKDYPCGEISTLKLKNKINNKFITCKSTNIDRYKRFIAECFKNKTNINRWMVRNGYAVAYKKYSRKYLTFENLAKDDKLGIWIGSFQMPWEWRREN